MFCQRRDGMVERLVSFVGVFVVVVFTGSGVTHVVSVARLVALGAGCRHAVGETVDCVVRPGSSVPEVSGMD